MPAKIPISSRKLKIRAALLLANKHLRLKSGSCEKARVGKQLNNRYMEPEGEEHVSSTSKSQSPGCLASNRDADIMEGIDLTFQGVSSWVPNLGLGGRDSSDQSGSRKQVLFNITAAVRAQEVLALMGPSGSGKTSLLSILGRRTPKEVVSSGSILFNGKPATRDITRSIGFVTQDDVLYSALTVWETLWYTARLRLPRAMTLEQMRSRVEAVIQDLGLGKCIHTIIGGGERRGISGGERKRVSVAHEMLIDPSLLFLDEPTSGLDSTIALSLITTLRALAGANRTIVTTIHQPSSRMYQKLDKLLLLSQGHAMYYGSAHEAAAWFESMEAPCPFTVNIADHILDCASGMCPTVTTAEEGESLRVAHIQAFSRFWDERGDAITMDGITAEVASAGKEFLPLKGQAKLPQGSPAPTLGSNVLSRMMSRIPSMGSSMKDVSTAGNSRSKARSSGRRRWEATWWNQMQVLMARNTKVNRFEALASQKIVQAVSLSAVVGLLWWQRAVGDSLAAARDTLGLLFFSMTFPMFMATIPAVFTFPSEMRYLRKERASGMYRLSAYYIAKILSDFVMDLALPSSSIAVVYFMGGLRYEAWAFFMHLGVCLLLVLTGQSFGLFTGTVFRDIKNASTLSMVASLTMTLVGGFFISGVPEWLQWLRYVSWVYYAYNCLLYAEFSGVQLYDCGDPDDEACEPVESTQQALGLQADPNSPVWLEAGILLAVLVAFRVLTYFVLNRRTKA